MNGIAVTEPAEAEYEGEVAEDGQEQTLADSEETAEPTDETAADEELVSDAIFGQPTDKSKPMSKAAIAAIVVCAVIIVALLATVYIKFFAIGNKYTKDYLDIDGRTAADIADSMGMEYEEFLEYYGLPKDLPKDTNANATEYTIPVGKYVELTGSDFAYVKELLGWDDSITEDMTWGEAIDQTKLTYYVGEDQLESFKAYYELDDSITGENTWGDIRHQYELKMRQSYEEQKAAEESEGENAEQAEEAADGEAEKTEDSDAEKAAEKAE